MARWYYAGPDRGAKADYMQINFGIDVVKDGNGKLYICHYDLYRFNEIGIPLTETSSGQVLIQDDKVVFMPTMEVFHE